MVNPIICPVICSTEFFSCQKDFSCFDVTFRGFNKNYVKTKIFPRKLGKKIVESEEIRHASDYDDFYIATREEAEEQIQTAKELVSRVEEYVQARWKKESEKTVRNAEYLVQNRINY